MNAVRMLVWRFIFMQLGQGTCWQAQGSTIQRLANNRLRNATPNPPSSTRGVLRHRARIRVEQ